MYPIANSGGEGASTPSFRPAAKSLPTVVVWPILSPSGANTVNASQEIYRVAYESAKAFLRPSPYELASRFVSNSAPARFAGGSALKGLVTCIVSS